MHAENDYFCEEYYAGESSKIHDMKFFKFFKLGSCPHKENNKKEKMMTSFLSITKKETCGISVPVNVKTKSKHHSTKS